MKKTAKIILASALALGFMTTTASADVAKGQKLFSKKLKKGCGMSGAKFAAQHSQDEWESIMEKGQMADEIKKLCPGVKEVKEKYIEHFYDFSYEYANDSGNVPSC
jgi:Spy/CpxP family protein refolding chaperone